MAGVCGGDYGTDAGRFLKFCGGLDIFCNVTSEAMPGVRVTLLQMFVVCQSDSLIALVVESHDSYIAQALFQTCGKADRSSTWKGGKR